jgi:1-phosphatidylinositol-4-phosphate 5-kinase
VLDQIQADCDFLKKIGVMDYSLLLGVHERDTSAPPSQQRPVPAAAPAPLPPVGVSPGSSFLSRKKPYFGEEPSAVDTGARDQQQQVGAAGAAGASSEVKDEAVVVKRRLTLAKTGSLLLYKAEATHVSDLQQDDGGLCSAKMLNGQVVAGDKIYFFGIVDFLQTYTAKKFLETNFKAIYLERNALSAVPPGTYAHRFHTFMSQIIE